MAKKIWKTTDLPRPVEGMVFDVVQPTKGPKTGAELVEDDAAWLRRHVKPEELAKVRASFQAQIERDTTKGLQTVPGLGKIRADSILETCGKCGNWAWTSPGHENAPCAICNWRNISDDPKKVAFDKDGGFMRAATKKEKATWFKKMAEREARWKAGAAKRAANLAEFNRRNFEDGKF